LVILLGRVGLFLEGGATLEPKKPRPLAPTDRGTVIFMEKYVFQRLPAKWFLIKILEGGDFEHGEDYFP